MHGGGRIGQLSQCGAGPAAEPALPTPPRNSFCSRPSLPLRCRLSHTPHVPSPPPLLARSLYLHACQTWIYFSVCRKKVTASCCKLLDGPPHLWKFCSTILRIHGRSFMRKTKKENWRTKVETGASFSHTLAHNLRIFCENFFADHAGDTDKFLQKTRRIKSWQYICF